MPTNDELYDAAVTAIENLFSDDSVPVTKAIDNMENLKSELDAKIDALNCDLENEEG